MQQILKLHPNKLFWSFAIFSMLCLAAGLATQQYLLAIIPIVVLVGLLVLLDTSILFFALVAAIPISINLKEIGSVSLDFPDEPLMLLITALAPLFAISNLKAIADSKILKHSFVGIIVIQYLWMWACTATSTNLILSLKFSLAKTWYVIPLVFMCAMVVYKNPKNIYKLFYAFIIPLVLMVLFIIYRHSKLGYSFEDVTTACAPYFTNHVVYGSIVSMFVPILFGAVLMCRWFSVRWLFAVAGFTILIIAVYLAYSRAAWAATLFASILAIGIIYKLVPYMFGLFYTALIAGVFFLNVNNKYLDFAPHYATGIMHDKLIDHLIATVKGKDISSNERFYRWVAAARMSADKPIMGYGPNTFFDNYKTYTVNTFRTYVSRNKERSTSHNYYLFMLVEQGWIGLILYSIFILIVFIKAQKIYHQTKDKKLKAMVLATVCMMGAFFVNNFFSELLENDKLGGSFYLGMGILLGVDLWNKKNAFVDTLDNTN